MELVNPGGRSRIILVCEHAGREIPAALGDLGLPPAAMDRHIAYDIGAEGVARELSRLLDAPLALQRYSRLVIDCNRPADASDAVPPISDGQIVPGNQRLTQAERNARFTAIHKPFHDIVRSVLDRHHAGSDSVLVTVHSFTPMLQSRPAPRPWQIGVLSNRDRRLAQRVLPALLAVKPDLIVAYDEPYEVTDEGDYAIPVHGEARGIEHVMFEIRNDLIAALEAQTEWAAIIAGALVKAVPPEPEVAR